MSRTAIFSVEARKGVVAEKQRSVSSNSEWKALPLRRVAAAWIYDYLLCLWLATAGLVGLKWFLGGEYALPVPLQLITLFIFLFRDSFFGGKGFGKQLLDLDVMDTATGLPPTPLQSATRNLVLLAPYFAYQVTDIVLKNGQFTCTDGLLNCIKCVGFGYLSIIVPLECFLMHKTGWRLADKLAGTTVKKRRV